MKFNHLGFSKVSEMRLELTRHNCHYPLKVARLPIPPSGHKCGNILEAFATKMRDFRSKKYEGILERKTGLEPDLGKVVLYQLSYFRDSQEEVFLDSLDGGVSPFLQCKGRDFF